MIKCALVFCFVAVLTVVKCEEELKIDVVSKPEVCEVKSKTGNMLTMHYTGTLADGTKFDSRPSPCEERERTFIMIKPDGVQRGLVGKIVEKFERKGLKLVALKMMWASEELLKKHYDELSDRPFFERLVKYVGSGPVIPMVWEGPNAVKIGRKIIGATNPAESDPGTIRGDFCLQPGKNVIHGSDSVESAKREIDLWFTKDELVSWRSSQEAWVYED